MVDARSPRDQVGECLQTAVVGQPAPHDGVQPPGEVAEGQVGAPVHRHGAELGAFGLENMGKAISALEALEADGRAGA